MSDLPGASDATRYPPMPAPLRIPIHPSGWTERETRLLTETPARLEAVGADARARLEQFLGVGVRLFGSGAAALLALLRAFDFPPASEVLVPSFISPVVIETVIAADLRPVLFDSEADGDNSPASLQLMLGQAVVAVVLPHYFGRVSRTFDECAGIARATGVVVIDDGAQAFGSEGPGGLPGLRGDAGILSFGRTKPLSAWVGGAAVSADADLLARVRPDGAASDPLPEVLAHRRQERLRRAPAILGWLAAASGRLPRLNTDVLQSLEAQTGTAPTLHPGPMPALSAALLATQLPGFPARIAVWQESARALTARLRGLPGVKLLNAAGNGDLPAHFPLLLDPALRFPVAAHLSAAGIQSTWFHYPVHRLPAYAGLRRDGMRNVEQLWRGVLCIPCRDLETGELEAVSDRVAAFARRAAT